MRERIKNILIGRSVPERLIPIELACYLCDTSFRESETLVEKAFNKSWPSRSEMLFRCFFELLAYYQYLVLIYIANILDLGDERLNLYGTELNEACIQIGMEDMELGLLMERAITDEHFHRLVSAYLADDRSISGLNDEHFSALLKLTGFEKANKDFIGMSYLVSFYRILQIVGTSYRSRDALATWIIHADTVNGFRGLLKERFKEVYPDKLFDSFI